MVATVATYVFGMMTLTRTYTITSYSLLALVMAYVGVAETRPRQTPLRLDARLAGALVAVSVVFLLVIHQYTKIKVHWN